MTLLKTVLDTCVYDRLVDDPATYDAVLAAVRAGHLKVLTTHVQEDELAATTDSAKRSKLLAGHSALATPVPTGAFVLGVSRLGQARLGCASGDATFDGVLRTQTISKRTGLPGRTNDAMIADTAVAEDAALVTAERKGSFNAAKRAGIAVWSVDEFFDRVRRGVFT